MADPRPEARTAAPPPGDRHLVDRKPGGFLAWFPWEKLLIWGLFLLAVYVLRHFFFIIFMTFMITYIMSGIVKRVVALLSPGVERVWLQRVVSAVGFIFLIGFLYGVGTFLYYPLKTQATDLVNYARSVNVDKVFNDFLGRTLGAWKFETTYRGKEGEEKWKAELADYRASQSKEKEFEKFKDLVADCQKKFREWVIAIEGEKAFKALKDSEGELLAWIKQHVLEKKFQAEYAERLKEWDTPGDKSAGKINDLYRAYSFRVNNPKGKEAYLVSEDFEKDRDESIRREIFAEILQKDPAEFKIQFKQDLGQKAFEQLAASGEREARFREFYEDLKKPKIGQTPPDYSYEEYVALQAHRDDREAFIAALSKRNESPEDRDKRLEKELRELRENKFVAELRTNKEEWAFLEGGNIRKSLGQWIPDFTKWVTGFLTGLFEIVVQLALSLLLSFFITFDLPRIKRGIRSLEDSRVRDFYREIRPSLISFGRLIGRAFQAQGLIAVFNTLLTFVAIKVLLIQNEVFLCSIVFLCSFIPVLGVVMSSAPIAIMAIIQPGGDWKVALMAIGAVLIIHFIETSILNPKILGDMLHLHPVMVLGILAIGEYFFGIWGLLLGVPVSVYIIRYVILNEDPSADLSSHGPPGGHREEAAKPPAAAPLPVGAGTAKGS